ncbi:hypothetical protein BGZ80_003029 [Entomortierella chlamydospora]|uniref:Ras-GEF domain-containing protein n=1 Tax=Entomortierella chlamydospora TaxID=101097 RepID=A0A9P6N160_9FUNG|nr:hypothetical protein BGZ80_003029 [Entomortierella chlamydospora]
MLCFSSTYFGGLEQSTEYCSELNPATSIEDLVDQLTVPDLLNPQDQDARTKVFLMIYRRFMRPRELLEMFIARFDALGEFIEDEPSEANLIRVRDHPNDILHRQTRQRAAAFLRERVAHFPCLNEMHMKILPLSFIGYFDSWRWRQLDHNALNSHTSSRNSSFSGFGGVTSGNGAHISAAVSIVSDEDSDSGYHDYGSMQGEEDMDEDREWGMRDEEDALQGCSSSASSSRANSANLDSIAEFAQLATLSGGRYPQKSLMPSQSPARDRRSSTGSFAQSSACAMDTFVAGRRGSASSVSSNPGPFTAASLQQQPGMEQNTPTNAFAEGEMPPTALQSTGSIPYIGKRSSSQAYRQQRSLLNQPGAMPPSGSPVSPASTATPSSTTVRHSAPIYIPGSSSGPAAPSIISLASSEPSTSGPIAAAVTKAAMILRDSFDEKIHPFSLHHGKSTGHTQDHPLSPMGGVLGEPAVLNYLTFMEVKDVIIAEQLTCIEYNLFKKLKPRDMLRQVWKTKKGSAAFQACIAHFNYVSSWVGTMILLPPKAKHRAKMIEKFISIAKILRDLGNYNTTMAIIGAMNTSSIHRLVQTRELVQGKEIWNTFKELEHLMSSERSFSEYRAALRVSRLPCIPYLGVHLGDLLSISEGNKDFRLDGSTLHWQKFVLMADVITMVMSFQQEPHYRIQPDPYVTRMITDLPVLDDEALYLKSVTIEPSKLNHSRSLSKFAFF